MEGLHFEDHRYECFLNPPPDTWGVALGGTLDLFDGQLVLVGSLEHIADFTRHVALGGRIPLGRPGGLPADAELALQVSHGVYDGTETGGVKWKPDTSYVAGLKLSF